MVNPYRGEVALEVDGQEHVLRLTLGVLAELETDLGAGSLLALVERFEQQGRHPRALMRAELWSHGDMSEGLPSVGDMLADAKAGFDGAAYDAGWAARAKTSMW